MSCLIESQSGLLNLYSPGFALTNLGFDSESTITISWPEVSGINLEGFTNEELLVKYKMYAIALCHPGHLYIII